MNTTGPSKQALREQYRALRRAIPAPIRALADASAQAHLLAHPAFRRARHVALYRPFDGEPETAALAAAAREAGQVVVYPRHAPGRPLEFVVPTAWTPGVMGLSVPTGTTVALEPDDVVVVPGIVFDESGYRLGFGAGHYDRTLAVVRATPIGLAYACQLTARLEAAPWDRPVAALATENELRIFKNLEPI